MKGNGGVEQFQGQVRIVGRKLDRKKKRPGKRFLSLSDAARVFASVAGSSKHTCLVDNPRRSFLLVIRVHSTNRACITPSLETLVPAIHTCFAIHIFALLLDKSCRALCKQTRVEREMRKRSSTTFLVKPTIWVAIQRGRLKKERDLREKNKGVYQAIIRPL
jgi:hypothetical protein